MNDQEIKTVIQKHSTKVCIFGMVGISLSDILFNYLFNTGVSPLLTFIISFSLAIHVFQKVLCELLPSQYSDK